MLLKNFNISFIGMKEASATMLSGIQAYQSCLLSLLGKPDGQLTVRFLEGLEHIESFPDIFLQTVIGVSVSSKN